MVEEADVNRIRDWKQILRDHGKQIGKCDASNKEELRTWISGVSRAKTNSKAPDRLVLELCGVLADGIFGDWLVDFVNRLAPHEATWDVVKRTIVENYLDAQEMSLLRDRVRVMRQKPSEDCRQYGTRFASAVSKAYTVGDFNEVLTEELIKVFIHGLKNKDVRRGVSRTKPTTLQDAFQAAADEDRAETFARGEKNEEEPMEIGAAYSTRDKLIEKKDKEIEELKQLVKTIQGETKANRRAIQAAPHLQQQPTTFYSGQTTHQPQLPPNYPGHWPTTVPMYQQGYAPQAHYNFNQQQPIHQNGDQVPGRGQRGRGRGQGGRWRAGNPTCYNCGKKGHIRAECRNITAGFITEVIQAALAAKENPEPEN